MNRRGFLRSLVGAAAVVPAARTWPFRTFFFPPAPRIAPENVFYDYEVFWLNKAGEIVEPLVWYPNPDQKAAWDELGRITTWNNLQRSPIRWSSRNDPLRFA